MEKQTNLLRDLDFRVAAVGTRVSDIYGNRGEIVAVSCGDIKEVCVLWKNGHMEVVGKNRFCELKQRPYFWVEGKPVYIGDTLYEKKTNKLIEVSVFTLSWVNENDFSWDATPKKTVKKSGWVNIFNIADDFRAGTIWDSKEQAIGRAINRPIATVQIEWEIEEN